MSKKRIVSLVVIALGFILIFFGLFSNNDKDENDTKVDDNGSKVEEEIEEDKEIIEEEIPETIDYDTAYNTAVSLYGGEGKEIEVLEESEHFVIYVLSSGGKQTYYMDKVTGEISSGDEGTTS